MNIIGVISCPTCEAKGLKKNLATVLANGYVSVLRRFHHEVSQREYTIIKGTDFEVICSNCNTSVFVKRETVKHYPAFA